MTKRAFFVGLIISILVSLWPAYSTYILRSARADYAHLSVALLIPFFILLFANNFLSRRGGGLSASELILIAAMGMVSALTQGEWLAGYFLGVITAPTYFASSENGWADTLLTQLPAWSIVADRDAAAGFYEGLPPGLPFPWQSWAPEQKSRSNKESQLQVTQRSRHYSPQNRPQGNRQPNQSRHDRMYPAQPAPIE